MKAFLRAHPRAFLAAVALILFAAVRWWTAAGSDWSRMRNPDENTIVRWIGQVDQYGYPAERVYPGGWFQLHRLRTLAERLGDAFESRSMPLPPGPSFGHEPEPPPARNTACGARRFNLDLLAGTAVLVLFAGLEAGFSLPAALFGAVFFAVQPAPIEFAHYCETDEALVFSLALALWLVLRALRRGGLRRFALAAFAAGFAFACKYTLAPLVLYAFLLPPLLPGRRPRTRRGAALAWAGASAAGLACFLAGFLLGTPAVVLNPEFFFRSLPKIAAMTYRETAAALGPLAGTWWAPFALRCGSLATEAAKTGAAAWCWLALAAVAVSRPPKGRLWAAAPLFTVLFVVYALLGMPWIRSQETLAPLVALCTAAGAPFDRALRRLREGGPGRSVAAAVVAAGAAVLVVSFGMGSRMLSAFRAPDTRRLCRIWTRTSASDKPLTGIDAYAGGTGNMFSSPNEPFFVRLPEHWTRESLESHHLRPDYYIRNASFPGRGGNRSLWTRRLRPEAQERLDAFRAEFPLLGVWRLPAGTTSRPVFTQHDLELYAIPRPDAGGADLAPVDLAFDRPRLVSTGDVALWTGDLRTPLGPVWSVRLVGKRHAVGLREPAPGERLRAVASSMPGGAPVRVEWDGPFAPRAAELPAGGAVAAELRPLAFAARSFLEFFPRARIRIRGDESNAFCDAWLSSDAAEVARALRLGGDPAAALAVVRAERAPGAAASAEGLLAAQAAGEEPDPGWREAAAGTLAAWDALAARLRDAADGGAPDPSAAIVRGAPLSAYRDFAHAFFGDFPAFPGEPLPLVLPPGTYRLHFTAKASFAEWLRDARLVDGQEGPVGSGPPDRMGNVRFRVSFSFRRTAPLRLSASLPPADPATSPALHDIELRWDPLESISRSAEELRSALDSVR